MLKNAAMGVFLVLATTLSVRAHDYWLQPQRFFLSKGEATDVQLFVGDGFVSEAERPFKVTKNVRFQLISRSQVSDLAVAAKDGKTPVARIAPTELPT